VSPAYEGRSSPGLNGETLISGKLSLSSLILAGCIVLAQATGVSAAEVSGPARVIDGDTLDIGTTRVRLFGIDAPEAAQRCNDAKSSEWACGRSATRALESLTIGTVVTCRGESQDEYGRLLGVCSTLRGEMNAALVRQGLAWAFVKYSSTYVSVEAEARLARRGVFATENERPWDFRAHRWDDATRPAEADKRRECPIKGNIARSGERIYHMPWQSSYEHTSIDERQGERWFCDEGEAERAGWRRAR
jgi:endonuclease YncB( thermonuclease family)